MVIREISNTMGIRGDIMKSFGTLARLCHIPRKMAYSHHEWGYSAWKLPQKWGRVIGAKPIRHVWMIPTVICWKSRQEKPPLSSLFLFVFPKNNSMFPCIDFHLTILIICYSHHSYSNYKPILLRKLGHHLF